MIKIVLLGPPGAGKGSLAKMLTESLGLLHISTGDLLREEMRNETALGKEVKSCIERGELVSDEVVSQMVENKFANDDALDNGYMLDGYPRTIEQAKAFEKILSKTGRAFDHALYMEAQVPVIINRLTQRRICRDCGQMYHLTNHPPKQEGVCDKCGGTDLYQRADDNEETIRKRMDVFLESTQPIVSFYEERNQLVKVNGDEDTNKLHQEILKTVNGDSK